MPSFHDEARAETDAAARWYDQHLEGLGQRFYDEVESALERVVRFPRLGARYRDRRLSREVRRVNLETFPYAILHLVEPRVMVIAVAHAAREQGYWIGRLE